MRCSKRSTTKEVYSNTSLLQGTKQNKKSNKKLILQIKQLEKEEQTKPKVSRRKEIQRSEQNIYEIEILKKENFNGNKSRFFEKINRIDKLD